MAEQEWYYSDGEDQHGPVSHAELKRLALGSQLKPDNLVWCDGMDDWQPASEIKGLIPDQGKKPRPVHKPLRPARRKDEPAAPSKEVESDVAPIEEEVEEYVEENVEEVEEFIDDQYLEEPTDDFSADEEFEEEAFDDSLGLEEPSLTIGPPPAPSQGVYAPDSTPARGMGHSLVLLVVWAGCGVFVAVGGVMFLMKWRSLEESSAVTAEAGAFLVQFVGAYVFARASERVLQLLADMSRR